MFYVEQNIIKMYLVKISSRETDQLVNEAIFLVTDYGTIQPLTKVSHVMHVHFLFHMFGYRRV